jgi:hypothetical protein
MAKSIAFEVGDAGDMRREILLSGVARCLNNMFRMKCTSLDDTWFLLPLKDDCPLALRLVPVRFFDLSPCPYVELEQLCVGFEKLSKFILGCEDLGWSANGRQRLIQGNIMKLLEYESTLNTYLANVQES